MNKSLKLKTPKSEILKQKVEKIVKFRKSLEVKISKKAPKDA